MELNKRKIAL